ncbi:MAG: biopolymer transporter ExbD [Myxococcota bacterium]
MGMSSGNGGDGRKGALSEINVTPLVDVMLVLLIIFMVAAGVQTVEMEAEREQTLEEAERILEEARALKDQEEPKHQEVGVDLPKVDNEALDLSEVKKLKLTVSHELEFSIDGTTLVDCLEVSPEMKRHLGAPGSEEEAKAGQVAFEPCLKALGERLVDNRRLQEDQEIYVLADRRLDYGKVLRVMAAVRQSGVTKFGLVAEPGLLGGAEVEPTAEDLE